MTENTPVPTSHCSRPPGAPPSDLYPLSVSADQSQQQEASLVREREEGEKKGEREGKGEQTMKC